MKKPDETLKLRTALEAMVDEHSLKTILIALGQVCKKKGHTLRYDKNNYPEAELWYQAGAQMANTAEIVPHDPVKDQ